ncbi:hypothetical protein JCM11641_000938 [Rhodosporidiobolus odoratus]
MRSHKHFPFLDASETSPLFSRNASGFQRARLPCRWTHAPEAKAWRAWVRRTVAGLPEKREKQFRKSCPVATQERANRVRAQRFFCVDRTRTSEITEVFKVLGSTGNQYTVQIGKIPQCDCPDGRKNGTCKHILFVMLKILQVPQTSNLWYQAGLLASELTAIFAHARPAPRSVVDERVSKAYRIAIGQEKPEAGSSANEDFTPGSEAGLTFCLSAEGCGNPLHNECFQNWARTSHPTTCPLCRTKWNVAAAAAVNPQAGPSCAEGYANFAAQAGLSSKRDTSSYYRGPRYGERWGGGGGRYGDDDYGWEDEY